MHKLNLWCVWSMGQCCSILIWNSVCVFVCCMFNFMLLPSAFHILHGKNLYPNLFECEYESNNKCYTISSSSSPIHIQKESSKLTCGKSLTKCRWPWSINDIDDDNNHDKNTKKKHFVKERKTLITSRYLFNAHTHTQTHIKNQIEIENKSNFRFVEQRKRKEH